MEWMLAITFVGLIFLAFYSIAMLIKIVNRVNQIIDSIYILAAKADEVEDRLKELEEGDK